MRASDEGHQKCVKLLLEKGATINFESTVSLLVNNFPFCEKSSGEVYTTAHWVWPTMLMLCTYGTKFVACYIHNIWIISAKRNLTQDFKLLF